MRMSQIFPAWRMILKGRRPFLSIELTRECPLHCPGCYAYDPNHAGVAGSLRTLGDLKGNDLVKGVLAVTKRFRPLHLSIVGGEPLVRCRELDTLLPLLAPTEVQLVTSAVRPIPPVWAKHAHVHIVVSVDGLPQEHNRRRAPATYDRILENIAHHQVIIHCTITRQLMQRPRYLHDFASFWSKRPEVRKIWFSLFTPQSGQFPEERLSFLERERAVMDLAELPALFPKVYASRALLDGYAHPPESPAQCTFARITTCISADLETEISPCELGGKPECRQCGCIASAGLAAISRYRIAGLVAVDRVYQLSCKIGDARRRRKAG
ncbi:MAG TPA: radical SAM protein [Bryobacteraceae bacterium]|nr:radical SAM protein [Bryobacteraceae bacterium]